MRFGPQEVERMDVFEKTLACSLRRNGGVVKIDVLAFAIVRSYSDYVALVGHNIYECELAVEAADGRVSLAYLFARFDGEADRWRVRELEAHDGMGHPSRAPIIDCEVDARDLREPHRAHLPVRRVIGLSAVFAVANIVQNYVIVVNLRPGELPDVGLPICVISRLESEPPR